MSARDTAPNAELVLARQRLTLSLLRWYAAYGAAAASILLVLSRQPTIASRLGSTDPALFAAIAMLWFGTSLTALARANSLSRRLPGPDPRLLALLGWDILALVGLLMASGGTPSGLGLLLLPTLAAAAILLPRRHATGLAAFAVIALLVEEYFAAPDAPAQMASESFQTAVLGILCLITAGAIGTLARRMRQRDIQAVAQAANLEQLAQLNRQIIERMRTGIVVVDADNRIRLLNRAAGELLADTAAGAGLPPAMAAALGTWRRQTDFRPEPLPQPGYPTVRLSFCPVRQDDPDGDIILFAEDAAELQQQALQLKLASLGQWSASIAHEIRNPLAAISHAAQLLLEAPGLEAGDRRLTEIIRDHCGRMDGIIAAVLATSRRQPANPVRFPLAAATHRAIERFRAVHPEAGITTDVTPESLAIRMDPDQFDQALTNLLDNATRHSRLATGLPSARVTGGIDPGSGRPFLEVLDAGSGVPAAHASRLFEPFFSTVPGGTGLGLSLVREYCEANQARIDHRPGSDGGACFRITFSHPDRVIA